GRIAADRGERSDIVAAHRYEVECPRRRVAIDRILECVGLAVEVGHDLFALPDLRAAISEIEVVAARVRRERIDRKSEHGVIETVRKYGLGDEDNRLVRNEVGERVAVRETALEISLCRGRRA